MSKWPLMTVQGWAKRSRAIRPSVLPCKTKPGSYSSELLFVSPADTTLSCSSLDDCDDYYKTLISRHAS
jgi:hypothetical protein